MSSEQTAQMRNVILQGDVMARLKDIPDESVDCVITSPPYWALRDYSRCNCVAGKFYSNPEKRDGCAQYGVNDSRMPKPDPNCPKCRGTGQNEELAKNQLGLEPTFTEYLDKLLAIFDEVRRVLKKTGTLWVNLGDTYSGSGGAGGDYNEGGLKHGQPRYKGSRKQQARKPITCDECNGTGQSDDEDEDTDGNRIFFKSKCYRCNGTGKYTPQVTTTKSIPAKSLLAIPDRFKIGMIDKGWICRNDIIWWKRNAMPSSAKDRFTVDYERVFFFTKSQKYYFETQYEPHVRIWDESNGGSIGGTGIHKATVSGTTAYQEIIRKPTLPNPLGRIKRTVWDIPTKPFSEAHFATYPEELVSNCIKAGCPVGGLVLDIFFGSGTTGVAAMKLGRDWLGIELNGEYVKIAEARMFKGCKPLA